jgi:hypothetical protein
MFNQLMTEKAGYLLFCDMLPVHEFSVFEFFSPVDMAEETPLLRNSPFAELDRCMTAYAQIALFERSDVLKWNALVLDSCLRFIVADGTTLSVFGLVSDVQMAEETDVHRDLHMLTLDDVGMAAAAVEVYSPSVLSEMGFVIEDDLPSRKDHLGFYQPHLMAPCLEAL